jgi:sulfite reductase alpha subunit-like flavoprotein
MTLMDGDALWWQHCIQMCMLSARAAMRRSQRAMLPAEQAKPEPIVTVLYGSQTGTAQEIARDIYAEGLAKGMKLQVRARLSSSMCESSACSSDAEHAINQQQQQWSTRGHQHMQAQPRTSSPSIIIIMMLTVTLMLRR